MLCACPNCGSPFDRRFRVRRCEPCQVKMREALAALDRYDHDAYDAYRRRWYVPEPTRPSSHPVRELVDSAIPLAGKIFFFQGQPYLPRLKFDEVRDAMR